jgi:thioredoxin reductase
MHKRKVIADVAVIGAGPAGMSAAIQASDSGARVILIDENKLPGGQLFKQIHKFFGSEAHSAKKRGFRIAQELVENVRKAGVKVLLDSVVWGIAPGFEVGVVIRDQEDITIEAKKIIVATGAAENALSFEGNTMPGVIGAGAAQTLMNIRDVMPGKRALVVGSGNVGLIVSYQLLQAGVDVVGVVEAAPKIGGYMVHANKLKRAGVPIMTKTTIVRAEGNVVVEKAVIADVDDAFQPIPGSEREIEVDLVCLAVGLHPMSQILRMLGCEFGYSSVLGGHVPLHDDCMETSVRGVYVAGDVSGIEEASVAMEEGRLAGLCAAKELGYLKNNFGVDVQEYWSEIKKDILTRIDELRGGEHGEKIADAKRIIMRGAKQ